MPNPRPAGQDPDREGLQSGPRKDSETTFWNFRILKFVKNIMKKLSAISKMNVHQGDGAPKRKNEGGGGVWPAKSLENANPAREQNGLGITALM